MTVYELRKAVSEDTILWIQKADGGYCEENETTFLSHKWDAETVKTMYPEYYKALGVTGITVVI